MRKCGNAEKVKSKRSFTLVEVVFTISIIGVLLAILMPAMSAIKLSAQKIQDVSHLKKVAEAWQEYSNRGYGKMPVSSALHGTHFMMLLAGVNKNFGQGIESGRKEGCILNDPYVYVSSNDKYASPVQCESIGRLTKEGAWYWNVPLKSISNGLTDSRAEIFSYCFAWGIDPNVPLDRTPLAFTRGLKENGTWDEKYGLYGDKGGYVVFCDGHTTWFDGSRPAKFLHWNGQQYTSNIRETHPEDVLITCGWNVKNNLKGSDGSLIVTHNFGLAK
jgi:type II secretory pathway pseudopilin PulG